MDGPAADRRPDRVLLAGALVGLAALGLAFLTFRPNRLAAGQGVLLLARAPWLAAAWLAWWLAVAGAAWWRGRAAAAALTLAAAAAFPALCLTAGALAGGLLAGQPPAARASLGPGFWLGVLGLFVAAVQGLRRAGGGRGWAAAALALAVGGTAGLMAAGALDDLSLLREYAARRGRFFGEVADHLFLVGVSVGSAVAVGVPLGFLARSRRAWERPLFFVLNLAQTIPSLALFGLLIGPLALLSRHWELARELGVRGIGWAPAVIALGLYALLPIARNTYTSLKTLDPGVLEAGRGMGMGRGQLLWRVELPLALPVILAGVRTAAVQNIGNTAVAALIGAGGLGVFIFQGLGQAAVDLILLGAVPTILIAVAADFAFQGVIGLARPGGAP